MKKLLLFSLSICFALSMLAQNKAEKSQFLSVPSAGPTDGFTAVEKDFPDFTRTKSIMDEDIVIGETVYDLQTNSAVQNRLWVYDDGTMGAAWTMGFESAAGFPGRGTGYNYYNGTSWGFFPDERLQSIRCGWPSYAPFGENGEITCAHSSDNTIVFNWRENKGVGDWTEFVFEGPDGGPGLLWPRMITSGANHDTIHLLALTTPTGNGGTIYEGMDGALLYSRSVDGGATWNPHNIVIPEINSDYFDGVNADAYSWAYPNAGKLAFVINGATREGVVLVSEDGGDSWQKTTYMEMPWGGMQPENTDRFGSTDGSLAVGIDNDGKIHVVAGRMCHRIEAGARSYYPWSNGLMYWNEDMNPLDTATVGATGVYIVPETLADEGYLLDEVDDPFDSLAADVTRAYETGIVSQPQIVFDDYNNIIVTYQKLAQGFVNGDFNYRHVWQAWSYDMGESWTHMIDLTGDLFHLFSECAYPSTAPVIYNDMIHCVYQTDNLPGVATGGNADHEYVDNNMVYLPIDINVGIEETPIDNISYISQNYPNPFSDKSYVQVNTKTQANLSMVITNLVGKRVAEYDKGEVEAGVHYFIMDASVLPKGMYLYTVYSGKSAETRKMIVE